MTDMLRTAEQIQAAGAEAVTGWDIPDHVVEQLVTLIGPVAADVQVAPARALTDDRPAG
ncbi:hypothetical protein [Micromonospora sp. C41]|uniref:hypothetical protein n=1 Tax=Micromonospora sp. C41 TaxID=2824878 RepID=UPI001B374D2B|nr:hypothetical protein [Micromonospora sp. C41]MBQ1060062.1 hypothetical protein [Micromonospora sp. C41]